MLLFFEGGFEEEEEGYVLLKDPETPPELFLKAR